MINVSPIERGHVLLVPQLDHCLPQVHTLTQTDRHIVMINVSPIERGHVLLVPQLDHCLPQVHTLSHRQTDTDRQTQTHSHTHTHRQTDTQRAKFERIYDMCSIF